MLPKDYARPALDKTRLGQLIDLVSNIRVGDQEARAKEKRNKAAKEKDNGNAAELAREAADIEADLPDIPIQPQIWTSDATPERLGALLAEHGEAFGLEPDWGWHGSVPNAEGVTMSAQPHVFGTNAADAADRLRPILLERGLQEVPLVDPLPASPQPLEP